MGAWLMEEPISNQIHRVLFHSLAQWRFNYAFLGVRWKERTSPIPKQTPGESEMHFSITSEILQRGRILSELRKAQLWSLVCPVTHLYNFHTPWGLLERLEGKKEKDKSDYLYITACLPILFLTKIPIKKMPRCTLFPWLSCIRSTKDRCDETDPQRSGNLPMGTTPHFSPIRGMNHRTE